jgi:hypothetical protein
MKIVNVVQFLRRCTYDSHRGEIRIHIPYFGLKRDDHFRNKDIL